MRNRMLIVKVREWGLDGFPLREGLYPGSYKKYEKTRPSQLGKGVFFHLS